MRILGDANAPVLRSWGIVKFHKTRQGKARQSKARQGKARQGKEEWRRRCPIGQLFNVLISQRD
jgi:hypothetical protein